MIEGKLAMEAVLASPYPLLSVMVLRRRLPALRGLPLPAEAPVYVVDDDVMAGTAGFNVHRGLLGIGRRLPLADAAGLLGTVAASLVVVVEGLNDQVNLGAIFRNAAAFGAGAVLLSPNSADPLYRRTVRVSLGHALRVPYARLEPWPEAIGLLKAHGFVPLALTPSPQATAVQTVASELEGQKVALVVGSEGDGLSRPVLELCRPVRVPMVPGVDSLNVASATAVALHRFSRLG